MSLATVTVSLHTPGDVWDLLIYGPIGLVCGFFWAFYWSFMFDVTDWWLILATIGWVICVAGGLAFLLGLGGLLLS